MAYTKSTTFSIRCDGGLCDQKEITVPKFPPDWYRLKIMRASVPNGEKQVVKDLLLCPHCVNEMILILQSNGVAITPLKFGTKKSEGK